MLSSVLHTANATCDSDARGKLRGFYSCSRSVSLIVYQVRSRNVIEADVIET